MRIALCQVASTSDPEANLGLVEDALAEARDAGARVAVLPEATHARFGSDLVAVAEPVDGPWATRVAELASSAGLVAVVGMFTPADAGRVHNTLLVTGDGRRTRYDKVHLFDALGHRESRTVAPGHRLLAVDVDDVRVGVATCYDVRFPAVFDALARAGAHVVAVPASWAPGRGKREQWRLLLRARALDATVWVVGCDQAEPGAAGLEPIPGAPGGIGHSLAASPRGDVVGSLGEAPGVISVDVVPEEVAEDRAALPVLRHAVALSPEAVDIAW